MSSFVETCWEKFCALRFVIVGGWNTVFCYLVFAGLYHAFGGGWRDVPVQIVAAIIGITHAYVLHRLFTFRSHGTWWKEYLRFYVVYGSQTLLQMAAFFLLVTGLKFNAYIIQLILTIALTILSYWAHRNFSFRKPTSEVPQ